MRRASSLAHGCPDGDKNNYTDHLRDLSLDAHVVLQRPDQLFQEASFQIPTYRPQHSYPYVERQAVLQPPSIPPYIQSAYFEVPPSGSHFPYAMSGCQFRPATPRFHQATSLNPCSPNPYARNTVQRQATSGTIWSKPSMSKLAPPMQCDLMGAFGGVAYGPHTNHGVSSDEIGNITPSAYDGTGAAWNGPSISNYASDAPSQLRPAFNPIPEGSCTTSALFPRQLFSHCGSCDMPSLSQRRRAGRMPWSVSSRSAKSAAEDRPRKAYHPQPPAKRGEWAMWVGNM